MDSTAAANRPSKHFRTLNSQPHRALRSLARRQNAVAEAAAASRCWAATTARTLATLLAPELREHETLPDLALLQELIGRALERRWQAANEADAEHGGATDRYRALLEERDAAARALYRGVVDLRTLTRGALGKEAAGHLLCLDGPTSRDPVALLRQADRITARLRSCSVPLVTAAADAVAAQAETLRTAVAAVARTVAELDGLTLDRQRALDAFNTTFVALAGCLEALYHAAGRPDQALRVRPSRRHPGRLYVDVRKVQRKGERCRARSEAAAAEETSASLPRADEGSDQQPCVVADGGRSADRGLGSDRQPSDAIGDDAVHCDHDRREVEDLRTGAEDLRQVRADTDGRESGLSAISSIRKAPVSDRTTRTCPSITDGRGSARAGERSRCRPALLIFQYLDGSSKESDWPQCIVPAR